MVLLPEDTQSLCGIDDARVLVCVRAIMDGVLENGQAAGPQHPPKLPHRLSVVGNVLEDVVADEMLKRAFGSGMAVMSQCFIAYGESRSTLKWSMESSCSRRANARLRGNVQETGACRHPVAEPQPEDAMALERTAMWAARVRPTAMRGEPARSLLADRTPDVTAGVPSTVRVGAGVARDRPCTVADDPH
jgi:hypothetical protein